jgi:hypothetical protein
LGRGVWGVCGGRGVCGRCGRCGGVGSLLTFDIPQTALVATLDTYDFNNNFFFFENQKKYFCKLKLFSQAE